MPNVPLPFLADPHKVARPLMAPRNLYVFSSEVTEVIWGDQVHSLHCPSKALLTVVLLPSIWLTCIYPADIHVDQLWALASFSWLYRTLFRLHGAAKGRTLHVRRVIWNSDTYSAVCLYLLVLLRLDLECTISISQYTALGPVQFFDLEDKTKHSSQSAFSVHGKCWSLLRPSNRPEAISQEAYNSSLQMA